MKARIALLPGDGIGPEIIAGARSVLEGLATRFGHSFEFREYPVGGCALDHCGMPLPIGTLSACRNADAILLGAVGGPKWSDPKLPVRPEHGLLELRKRLGLYANLRPIKPHQALWDASPLRPDRLMGVDFIVVRELTGGIYYGERSLSPNQASDVCSYTAIEIERVVHRAARLARSRRGKLTMIDKANVLDTSRLWRQVTTAIIERDYPDLELEILLVDAAAMHLLDRPSDFDVIVTENLFGDILTDEASMLVGSLGLLPSASLGDDGPGLFEPAHGSAPELAGQDRANPFATLLSAAMLLEHGLGLGEESRTLSTAVQRCISEGHSTSDIGGNLGTRAATQAVIECMHNMAQVA